MKRRTFKVFKEEGACVSYLGVVFSELFQNYNNSITYLIYKILKSRGGEGNGTLLQYSCLENPMDGGALWAAVHGVARSWTQLSDFTFTFHFSLSCTGEGHGNPLQCSCLENPRDRGAWWAAIAGVTQGRTRLKRFSSSSSKSRGGILRFFVFPAH